MFIESEGRTRSCTGFRHDVAAPIVTVAAALLLVQSTVNGQVADSPATRQQIARIGADLFSTTPHLAEDVTELKALLAADSTLADAHLLLGIAYRAQGSPDLLSEAVAELRQAIALNSSLSLARVVLARVYLDMARASRARQELESALELAPGDPQILALLGEAERQLGDPTRAVELNRQALKADAAFVQARFYLGLALLDLKQHAEAIRELQLVVKSGANGAEASLGLGMAYLAAGRIDEGLTTLRGAVRLDASRPEAHLQLARAYRLKGLFSEALAEQKVALSSGSATLGALYTNLEPDVYMEEGLVRLQQGRLEAAAAAFQKVLDLDAGAAEAKKQLALVRKRMQERDRKKNPGPL